MSNSTRWRKLMQWLRLLCDEYRTDDLTYTMLMDKIDEIKRGNKTRQEPMREG